MKNELGTKLLELRTGEESSIYQVGFGWVNDKQVTIDLIREAVKELGDIISVLKLQNDSKGMKRYLQIKDQMERMMLSYRYDERDEGLDDNMWTHCE